MKKIFLPLVCVLALTGCASTGNAVLKDETEQSVSTKIIQGKTTKAEIRKMFGAPLRVSFTDAGNEIYGYSFTKTQANASNFIPFVGILASGMHGTEKSLTVMFDDKGIVKRYSMDESAVSTNTGLIQ